jgi:ferredoxin
MANITDKVAENVLGRFFVDSTCIDCDACRQAAPNHFDRSAENGYSYVTKQPQTDEEVAACQEALDGCPVSAIGDSN